MGYYMYMEESTVIIRKEYVEDVVKSLKEFVQNANRLSWINSRVVLESESIEEIFDEIRYELTKYENGDYLIENFIGEKLGSDFKIFGSIAKYIEDGQYIEMNGEDGDMWRWIFKNGECKEIHPKISWDM